MPKRSSPKKLPEWILPEHRDQLLSEGEARELFVDAGVKIHHHKLYEAYREGALSVYIVRSQILYLRSEIMAAIKQFPRSVPRREGFYPKSDMMPAHPKPEATLRAEKKLRETPVRQIKFQYHYSSSY